MLLKNQWAIEEIKEIKNTWRNNKKYREANENENTTAKAILRGKFRGNKTCLRNMKDLK